MVTTKNARVPLAPGIRVNDFNILIVDKSAREVGHKTALNYLEAKIRIQHALAIGKTVLFLPGIYDLLHLGHLVWFAQAIHYFTTHLSIPRDSVYVVVPIDNDRMARMEKILLHTSQGGSEIFLRPIIDEQNRATALANLPYVDLVMSIPSPLDAEDLVRDAAHFDVKRARALLGAALRKGEIRSDDYEQAMGILAGYQKMALAPRFQEVKRTFVSKGCLAREPEGVYQKIGIDSSLWSNAVWQLMCYLSKMDREVFTPYNSHAQKVYRIISKHDGYSPQVGCVMRLAGIEPLVIEEEYVTSTTSIIKEHNTRVQMEELIASRDPRNYRFS